MRIITLLIAAFVYPFFSLAEAPASVTGDHLHSKGSWMFGYRYMFMDMDGHKIPKLHKAHAGNDHVEMHHDDPRSEIDHSNPHKHTMTMQMHMLEAMYGVTDDFTLMAMINFLQNRMDHGGGFKTRNEGIGDTSLTALYRLYGDCHQESLIGGLGLSFPTGDITESDNYHSGKSHHPYHMTLGSGTFDLLPSLTYTQSNESYFWGVQGTGAIRLDDNTEGYKFGDKYVAQSWIGTSVSNEVSVTARLAGTFQGAVRGRDETITAIGAMWDPKQQESNVLEAGLGAQLDLSQGVSLGVEFTAPLAEDIDYGVHERKWYVTASLLGSL